MAETALVATRPLALVTGASVGIGAALAAEYASHGYDLVLVARREAELRALAERLAQAHGVHAEALALDLGDRASVDAIVSALKGRAPDALVNNAGIGLTSAFLAQEPSRIDAMIELNVVALTRLCRALLPAMVARGRGHVLNVASTAGFQAGPFAAVYSASKAYVLSLSEALHEELRGTGVTVTALCPGATATEFASTSGTAKSRLFTPSNVMRAADVARMGYAAAVKGKAVRVTGLRNAFLAHTIGLAPRALVRRASRKVWEPR